MSCQTYFAQTVDSKDSVHAQLVLNEEGTLAVLELEDEHSGEAGLGG